MAMLQMFKDDAKWRSVAIVIWSRQHTLQLQSGEQDVFRERKNAIVRYVSRLTKGFLQLSFDVRRRINQIDFRVFVRG